MSSGSYDKKQSNPFSTGGGGVIFETRVQASFLALMLSGGYCPGLPVSPIKKLQLQGKHNGFNTDDLIVYLNDLLRKKQKLLAKNKHSITISESDKKFKDVIHAAWHDFVNLKLFSQGSDRFALITGPLKATDIDHTRMILEWARTTENAEDFLNQVELGNFSTKKKADKLKAFRVNLDRAKGSKVSDNELWRFMRHFLLLGYDLDVQSGVALSLLNSLMKQYSRENTYSLWAELVNEVQTFNQNAGTITFENISSNLTEYFKRPVQKVIPDNIAQAISQPISDLTALYIHEKTLTEINLIGSWNENNDEDKALISMIYNQSYQDWIEKARVIYSDHKDILRFKDGKWKIRDRIKSWEIAKGGLYNDSIERFKEMAMKVLSERDPQFDLPSKDRFAASIYDKKLDYSDELRRGVAETLALLGSKRVTLPNVSSNKDVFIASSVVQAVLGARDWDMWASLNSLQPLFAEAAPSEYIDAINRSFDAETKVFQKIFSEEGSGFTGTNYLTGILWGLESLAWEANYLSQVVITLGDLASIDRGGNWANRPANSLTSILLPWHPQTLAGTDRRIAALKALQRDHPDVAWELLISLLPNQMQTTMGTHKPEFRDVLPKDWEVKVSNKDYWEQVESYGQMLVELAGTNLMRLEQLIPHVDNLPKQAFDMLMSVLGSEQIIALPDEKKEPLWSALLVVISNHRKHSDAKWAMPENIIGQLEAVTNQLVPEKPQFINRRLFTQRDYELYDETKDWEDQDKKLLERRDQAISKIFENGHLEGVLKFLEDVEDPYKVGYSLASLADNEIDKKLLPSMLTVDGDSKVKFLKGYIWRRNQNGKWNWPVILKVKEWSKEEIAALLKELRFEKETWSKVKDYLDENEELYWSTVVVNPYAANDDLDYAIEKLIFFERKYSALDCLYSQLHRDKHFDENIAVKILLLPETLEEPKNSRFQYNLVEIIKYLQKSPKVEEEDLVKIEFRYLPFLNTYNKANPVLLEQRLANDPNFFMEVICFAYKPRNQKKNKKELSENDQAFARQVYQLLHDWKKPPGIARDSTFKKNDFKSWVNTVREKAKKEDRYEVAMLKLGEVLICSPKDEDGFWIDHTIAAEINKRESEEVRRGYRLGLFNSRGVHYVDPEAKPEKELVKKYFERADLLDKQGYARFAATLRSLGLEYKAEAAQIIERYQDNSLGDDL